MYELDLTIYYDREFRANFISLQYCDSVIFP